MGLLKAWLFDDIVADKQRLLAEIDQNTFPPGFCPPATSWKDVTAKASTTTQDAVYQAVDTAIRDCGNESWDKVAWRLPKKKWDKCCNVALVHWSLAFHGLPFNGHNAKINRG